MVFVDTNVLVYAVGREHPLRDEARAFFRRSLESHRALATSAEVLQELLHIYLPVGLETLDAALSLAAGAIPTIWPVERADVEHARELVGEHPALGARDLLHLACCRRRRVDTIQSFDRALAAAY